MSEIKSFPRTKVYAVINFWEGQKDTRSIVFVTKNKEQAEFFMNEYKKLYQQLSDLNAKFSTSILLNHGGEIEIEETFAI